MRHQIKQALRLASRKLGIEISRYNPFSDAWNAQLILLRGVKNPLIFDVGAHTGGTLKRYKALFPHANFHCFEPFPATFQALQTTVALASKGLSAGQNVALHCLALSDQVGEHDFHVSRDRPATNSLFRRPTQQRRYYSPRAELNETIRVRSDTLDHFCEENSIPRINVLKMDVQGGELRVLQGASALLSRSAIDIIYTEALFIPHYDQAPLFHSIALFLAERDYSLYGLYNLEIARNGQLRYGDAIFVSKAIRSDVIDAFPLES